MTEPETPFPRTGSIRSWSKRVIAAAVRIDPLTVYRL